jgi:hypothetical protein
MAMSGLSITLVVAGLGACALVVAVVVLAAWAIADNAKRKKGE